MKKATPATKKATVPSKLKIVKNEKAKIVKSPWDSKEIQNLVKKVATDISNEVVDATVRKALASTEFTKDILNATVRTAVKSAELQKKYPPLPENMQKLSEPTTATYIALYNKHRNVLKPKAVGVVKQKITDYLQKIEEISLRDKLDRAAQKDSRKKRKTEAIKVQKENKFANFCDEKCDEMFETFLSKFTDTFKAEREVPKPLILGPSSRRLYQTTQQQIKKLLGLKTNPETAKAPESNDAEKVVRGQTSKQIPDTNKVSDVGSTQIAQSRKNIPETLNAARAGDTSVADPLVAETGDVKETEENTEIVDRLSYFIMEFVQNSLVEAL